MIFRFCDLKIHILDTATPFVWLLVFEISMTDNLGALPILSRSRDNQGMNWICFLILWPRKPSTRHQNYISTIYSSWEKWTCMICRPSWTPSWISRNCQGLQGDTIIFLETGDLLKRLTPLAYLYHFAAHGTSFLNICYYTNITVCKDEIIWCFTILWCTSTGKLIKVSNVLFHECCSYSILLENHVNLIQSVRLVLGVNMGGGGGS